MTTDNFCFYLRNRLIQTCQTGGQQYSDTSPFSIPWFQHFFLIFNIKVVFTLSLCHTNKCCREQQLWFLPWPGSAISNRTEHRNCFGVGGNQPIYHRQTSAFNICINGISVVPSGGKTDVRRANTDVRWVGFHPLFGRVFIFNLHSFHWKHQICAASKWPL